ncbi:MAG: choice-of-anchor Q domain-containing protein [Paludibacteraceae bacterium]|nr:choice-of-anchor Q domain-containing protein [Paludibacteraceae bacterium]
MKKLIILLILTVISSSAFCKTITVTSSADSGAGTLRQAVLDANANDSIVFDANISKIVLSNQLILDKNLTINGSSTTKTSISVSAGYYLWEFVIQTGAAVKVNNLIFRDVNVVSTCAGAVVNYGVLTVTNCVFTNNKILRFGAGINNCTGATLYVDSCEFYQNNCGEGGALGTAPNSTAYISNSFFENNSAPSGSAIFNQGNMNTINCTFSSNINTGIYGGTVFNNFGGAINLINCTFNANSGSSCSAFSNDMNSTVFIANTLFVNNICSSSSSATIFNGQSSGYSSTLTLVNNTIAGNKAIGVYNSYGTAKLYNNIVWDSTTDVYTTNSGLTAANNLIGSSNVDLSGNNNIINIAPKFVGNGDYSLQAGSPAINAGNNNYLPDSIKLDLQGKARVSGSLIDMGAYEYVNGLSIQNIPATSGILVYATSGRIIVTNITGQKQIYTASGQRISSGYGVEFPVPAPGIYILKAGAVVQKVIVK